MEVASNDRFTFTTLQYISETFNNQRLPLVVRFKSSTKNVHGSNLHINFFHNSSTNLNLLILFSAIVYRISF